MDDLKTLEKEYGVNISRAKKENRGMKDGLLMERTLDQRIEDITQEVIPLASNQEEKFSNCIIAPDKKYRCPPHSLLPAGQQRGGPEDCRKMDG